jgi:hypothetical protein
MAITLTVNGTGYTYPETGDISWGAGATNWASAVTTGMLSKAGGTFTLTADADFGATYGIVSSYFKSRTSNPAQSGTVRLSNSAFIAFRDNANATDLILGVDNTDKLLYRSYEIATAGNSIINNAMISGAAAIAFSKMAALSTSIVPVSDGSGIITSSSVTATELGYLSGATSSLQTQVTARLPLAGGTMTGSLILVGTPSVANEAATKQYVDNAMLGISPKSPVIVATTVAGTLATSFENGDTIDGVVLATGNRILIKNQASALENGIYTVNASGVPTRATDMDTWAETIQGYTLVQQGSLNAGSGWLSSTSSGGTLGVTDINFLQFSSSSAYTADGQGIELSGTQFALELDGTTLSKSSSGLQVSATYQSTVSGKLTNPLTTTGDIVYSSSGTTGARLAIGSTNQVLQVVAGIPSWQTLQTNPTIVSASTGATLTSSDSNKIYLVDTSAARTFNLPAPASGLRYVIKDSVGTSQTYPITINPNSTEKIEGVAAAKLLQGNWGVFTIVSNGTDWFLV